MSPLVRKIGEFEIRIYFNDHPPSHVHVLKEGRSCKISLSPMEVVVNKGLNAGEIRRALKAVSDYEQDCWAKWDEIFPSE